MGGLGGALRVRTWEGVWGAVGVMTRDLVATEVSGNPMGSSGAGMGPRSCLELR